MGSRLKQNPEQTFNWFFEATSPISKDKDPGVQFQFPEDFNDEESSQTLPKFCFPYDIQRVKDGVAVQHFTFVLTDLEGCQRFGFCRLNNSTHNCLCILSYLPWFEVFYKLLNNLAEYLSKRQTNEMKELLAALYKQPIPLAEGSVTLQMVPYFIAPDPRSLPSIPENRNLTELIVAVDVGNLLQLYASMLFERRILIFASKLSTLTACVHALSAALYPMYWQHIFIPVLPPHLLDYCCAPMPYLIGVHSSLSERVRSRGLEEVVILNVDTNTLETPFDDFKRIPSDVMSGLKVCLKRQAVSPGSGVSRAFLKAQALLFGGYRDALQGNKEGEINFCKELFLDHKSPSMRHFLQSAIHLQFFKQFIDDRLDILNKGKEPDDLFEEEIIMCESTAGKSKSYHQLVGNLRKGGGALIHNMKTKANMRAKGLTKSGLKNLLMNKAQHEERSLHRGGSVSHRRVQSDSLQNRLPITQHFGRSRPRRPISKLTDKDDTKDYGDPWDSTVSESVSKTDSELQKDEEEGDDSLLCDSEEMDLLGEIFDTLSSRSSHERGLLYGTRSLDLFGPDSHDYITKRCPGNPSQESLSLSISGSGSIHSWNLETTEEQSDLTGDSDWLCQDTSQAEEEGGDDLHLGREIRQQDSEQKEDKDSEQKEDKKQKQEPNVAINGKQEGEEMYDGNTPKEVKLEEDKNTENEESNSSLGEDSVKDMIKQREEEGLKDKSMDKQGQSEEVAAGQETQETQEDKSKEVTDPLSKCMNLHPVHPNPVQEQQDQEEITAVLQQPENLAADLKPPAGQEKKSEKAARHEEQEVQQITSPPKVRSAIERFQSESSSGSFLVKPMTKILDTQTPPPHDSDRKQSSETPQEEDCPPLKVSELKKRFEA